MLGTVQAVIRPITPTAGSENAMTSSMNQPVLQEVETDESHATSVLRFDRRGGRRTPAAGWLGIIHHRGSVTLRIEQQLQVRMIDLSETGMGLRLDRPLPEGDGVTVLMQPHGCQPGHDLPAEVAWCEPDADGTYRAGIHFLRRDAA